MATREQARKRQERMRANGPMETVRVAEIGERDGWVCGICQDSVRLVDPGLVYPHPLSPSIDHIQPVVFGGPNSRANVQITHLFCNMEKNAGTWHLPEYMRALLARRMDGTPIPEEVYRADRAELSRRVAARPYPIPGRERPAPNPERAEYMIMLKIIAGDVAADPRYGDPAERLNRFAARFGEEAVRRGGEWAKASHDRRVAREQRTLLAPDGARNVPAGGPDDR